MSSDRMRTWLSVAMAAVAAAAVLGLVALWPRGAAPDLGAQPNDFVDATITGVEDGSCPGIEIDLPTPCLLYQVRLSSGPDEGGQADFPVQPTQIDVPELEEGDAVVLLDVPTSPVRYTFVDFQRTTPMIWLFVAFVVVVLLLGRFQGLRALAGLGISLGVLVTFVVPALLRDRPAVLVALVGTVVVAYVAIYLAHGVGVTSSIALAGTLVSLAATAVLALVAATAAELTGLTSQESQVLRMTADALDLRGLLIAGMVVGALGVLDDVTVTQVSTVAALRRANPALGARQLYGEATRVGRDHVASTVNTLVLAYAGASLPLLLFFAQGDRPFERILTGELVAVEVIRMLVGSIGIVLSVPVTTWLAAAILTRTDDIPDDDGHAHLHEPRHARSAMEPIPPLPEGEPDPWF